MNDDDRSVAIVTVCPTGCACDCALGGNCSHVWDGPTATVGEGGETATCSACGLAAIDHDLMVLP